MKDMLKQVAVVAVGCAIAIVVVVPLVNKFMPKSA